MLAKSKTPQLPAEQLDILNRHASYMRDEEMRQPWVSQLTAYALENGLTIVEVARKDKTNYIAFEKDGMVHATAGCMRSKGLFKEYKKPRKMA